MGGKGRGGKGIEGTAPPPKLNPVYDSGSPSSNSSRSIIRLLYVPYCARLCKYLFTHTLCLPFRCRVVAAASNIKVAAAAVTEVIENVTSNSSSSSESAILLFILGHVTPWPMKSTTSPQQIEKLCNKSTTNPQQIHKKIEMLYKKSTTNPQQIE